MTTVILPWASRGYAVDLVHGTVHQRYADHGTPLVKTYEPGVYELLKGRPILLCDECYPPPAPPKARKVEKPPKAPKPLKAQLLEPLPDTAYAADAVELPVELEVEDQHPSG